MGNFEKLVVLTVLFLSAIVLAFSLSDDGVVESAPPLEAARKALEAPGGETLPASETPRRSSEHAEKGAQGLLSSEVTPGGAPAPEASRGAADDQAETVQPGLTPAPSRRGAADPAPGTRPAADAGRTRILRVTEGLQPTSLDDYQVYVVRQGDTWNSLTQRFYQDSRYLAQLRAANEELAELVAGRSILVPVYDLTQDAGERRPYEPSARRDTPASPRPGGTWIVREGDTLSSISKAVYGTTTRWEAIYDANQDVLSSPDWLHVGTKLKLPPEKE